MNDFANTLLGSPDLTSAQAQACLDAMDIGRDIRKVELNSGIDGSVQHHLELALTFFVNNIAEDECIVSVTHYNTSIYNAFFLKRFANKEIKCLRVNIRK